MTNGIIAQGFGRVFVEEAENSYLLVSLIRVLRLCQVVGLFRTKFFKELSPKLKTLQLLFF
jgi:hypothetical protein